MIYIRKRMVPKEIHRKIIEIKATKEWKELSSSDNEGKRSFFDQLDKELIRRCLVEEQHGICAYCMKRITVDNTRIEHYKALKKDADKDGALDYNNMLGVCYGGEQHDGYGKKCLCCDAAKKDADIHISPLKRETIEKITYTKEGFVKTPNTTYMDDINNTLGLNGEWDKNGHFIRDTTTQLVAGRKAAYEACCKYMEKTGKKYTGFKYINELQKKVTLLESSSKYDEFIGVKLYVLKKRIRRGV